jgi:WD40 repeat protein
MSFPLSPSCPTFVSPPLARMLSFCQSRLLLRDFARVAGQCFLIACASTDRAFAKDPAAEQKAATISFTRQIAPLLIRHCVACHGPKKPEGDFQLHTFARLMKTGASDLPAVVPGNADASYLVELIASHDEDVRMPKEGKPLPSEDIELVRRWIADGAKFDGPDAAAPLESYLPKPEHPLPPVVYPRPVPVTALAFSEDGTLLASGGYHEVLLWKVPSATGPADDPGATVPAPVGTGITRGTLRLAQRIKNIAQRTHAIAFSSDGEFLAVATGTPGRIGEVKLLSAHSGELIADLATMSDEVFDVEFTRDGARLAACGADRTIRVFDVAKREEVRRIEAHADWVMAIAWSPDGTLLASAGRDKAAKLIDAASGTVLVTYPGHDEQVFDVTFSANGEQVYSAGRGRELHRWSADGKSTSKSDVRKKETGPILGRTRGDIHRLALWDKQIFALSTDGKVSGFDPEKSGAREPVMVYEGAPPQSFALAIHQPTKRIAVGAFDGRVTVYAAQDSAPWLVFIAAPTENDD